MIILLAVLALVVVKALAESPWGLFTILASIPIAMLMGIALRIFKMSVGWVSVFGVAALIASVVAGQWIKGSPLEGPLPPRSSSSPGASWAMVSSPPCSPSGSCLHLATT